MGGRGGGVLLHTCCNRLMAMCCWMGSHFHDLTYSNGIEFNGIDYNRVDCNGIDYGIDFNYFNRVIRIGSHIFGIMG